jgi:hypothetical protein
LACRIPCHIRKYMTKACKNSQTESKFKFFVPARE